MHDGIIGETLKRQLWTCSQRCDAPGCHRWSSKEFHSSGDGQRTSDADNMGTGRECYARFCEPEPERLP
jgi:hypothetical protein